MLLQAIIELSSVNRADCRDSSPHDTHDAPVSTIVFVADALERDVPAPRTVFPRDGRGEPADELALFAKGRFALVVKKDGSSGRYRQKTEIGPGNISPISSWDPSRQPDPVAALDWSHTVW